MRVTKITKKKKKKKKKVLIRGLKQLQPTLEFPLESVCLSLMCCCSCKDDLQLSGSVSAEATAWMTLRNYSCAKVCPYMMEISPDGLKSTFIRPQS